MTDPLRAHWGRLIGAATAVIAGAFVLPHVVRAPDLDENRRLADAPPWPKSPAGLTEFRKATDAYVADRFPPRAQLIGALNLVRMKLGVSGSPRVIVGRDGWLFSDDGTHLGASRGQPPLSDVEARRWLEGMAARTEAMQSEGRAYLVLAPPVKDAIYPDKTPGWAELDLNRAAVTLSRLASASGAGEVIYPHAPLAQQARWGLRVYDRYDTHWTGLGAYQGYVALMRSLERRGLTEGPRPLESFAQVPDLQEAVIPRDMALMLGIASFVRFDYPRIEDSDAGQTLRITYLGPKRDWTDLRVIETGQAGKPVLLMTVDSFSNALMPFLYSHFSRIVVAHNQDGGWRRDLIDRYQPDIVVTEALENGLRSIMLDELPASPAVRARIHEVVDARRNYTVLAQRAMYQGPRKRIEGGAGDERLTGTSRPDEIQGRPGDDTLAGLGGDDMIRGGRGADSLDGGVGRDWLSGGRENDTLRGGPDGDIFDIFEGAGTDQVVDFNADDGDRVEVDVGVGYVVRQLGPDTVVEVHGGRLILRGVTLKGLRSGWIRNR